MGNVDFVEITLNAHVNVVNYIDINISPFARLFFPWNLRDCILLNSFSGNHVICVAIFRMYNEYQQKIIGWLVNFPSSFHFNYKKSKKKSFFNEFIGPIEHYRRWHDQNRDIQQSGKNTTFTHTKTMTHAFFYSSSEFIFSSFVFHSVVFKLNRLRAKNKPINQSNYSMIGKAAAIVCLWSCLCGFCMRVFYVCMCVYFSSGFNR